ncbi:MAG: hypothetical protein ABI592_09690 [Acidobacteriota bacterium]
MKTPIASTTVCACGRPISPPVDAGTQDLVEVACACGRLIELRRSFDSWTVDGELHPEGSVPVGGFSRELRLQPDVERFWFPVNAAGGRLNVHLVFSAEMRSAEAKPSDMKAFRIAPVANASEARRKWLLWWESHPRASRASSGRTHSL